jgi:hypothetical protein
MKPKKLLLFIYVYAFFSVTEGFSQLRSGENVVIDEKVSGDLYVTGGTVTINAPVLGDLIVAGGTITVNDSISEDILVAGGNVILSGYVGDDIRCAGGRIKVSKNVAGDLVATGGKIAIENNAVVMGDLLVSGGEVTVDGRINGKVKSVSGEFVLNGIASKDFDARGGKIVINGTIEGTSTLAARTIELGPGAIFKGDVQYWNKKDTLDFQNSMQGGKATFDSTLEIEDGKWHYLGFASLLMVVWYLGTALVMTILIQYLFSPTFKNAANTVKNESAKSLGLGFLFLIAVPVAIVISFVTIVGLPVGMLLLTGYVTVLLLATVIVSLLAAHWINNTFYQSSWRTGRIVISAFGIFIFLKLATLTPFVGPSIMLLLACMSFGGILQNVKWKRNKALALT